MPRPTKAFRRQKVNAAAAYKRGDRKEAYKLWEQAAKSLKEVRSAKKKRHQKQPEAEAGAEGESASE
jgi:hypothetical protein